MAHNTRNLPSYVQLEKLLVECFATFVIAGACGEIGSQKAQKSPIPCDGIFFPCKIEDSSKTEILTPWFIGLKVNQLSIEDPWAV